MLSVCFFCAKLGFSSNERKEKVFEDKELWRKYRFREDDVTGGLKKCDIMRISVIFQL
jgi:hypothetical protein